MLSNFIGEIKLIVNLEVLENPVLAKEAAPNVEALLDTKIDSAESRETQKRKYTDRSSMYQR